MGVTQSRQPLESSSSSSSEGIITISSQQNTSTTNNNIPKHPDEELLNILSNFKPIEHYNITKQSDAIAELLTSTRSFFSVGLQEAINKQIILYRRMDVSEALTNALSKQTLNFERELRSLSIELETSNWLKLEKNMNNIYLNINNIIKDFKKLKKILPSSEQLNFPSFQYIEN